MLFAVPVLNVINHDHFTERKYNLKTGNSSEPFSSVLYTTAVCSHKHKHHINSSLTVLMSVKKPAA